MGGWTKTVSVALIVALAGCSGQALPDNVLGGSRLILVTQEPPAPVIELGSTISLAVTVQNVGEQAGTFTFNLLVDGDVKDEETMKLFSEATERVALGFTPDRSGTFSVGLATSAVEQNGLTEVLIEPVTVTVEKAAQLEVTDVRLSHAEAPVGTTVTATATIVNQGQRAGAKSVTLFVDNQFRSNQTVRLEPGAQADVAFPFTSQSKGTFTVHVDNSKQLSVQFYRPAAFQVLVFGASSTTPEAGDEVDVFFELRNTGDRPGTVQLQVLKDGTNVAGSQGGPIYIGPESSSGRRTFSLTVDWAGPKALQLTLDGAPGSTTEILAKGPQVEVTVITAPYNDYCYDELYSSYTIKNKGTGTARNLKMRVQVREDSAAQGYQDKTITRGGQSFSSLALAELAPGGTWSSGEIKVTPVRDDCGVPDTGDLRVIVEADYMTKHISDGQEYDT